MSAEVERLKETWIQAWLAKDVATVDGLMTSDYEYVAPNGQVLDRATIIAIISSPSYRLEWGTPTEVKFRSPAPDLVVVSQRWQGSGEYDGKVFQDDQRCTMVWVRRDGEWLLAHEHCSAMMSDE